MITPGQIRAARAMLKWKQADLVKASGVSLPSVNNIERDLISPRAGTLQRLRNAFEGAGIVFTEDSGIKQRRELFEILQYDGPDFIEKQNDDLFACMQGPDDEALMCSLNERLFEKHAPDQVLRYEAHHQKTRFKEKILAEEGDVFLMAQPNVYRWIPKELMGKVPYLVYKNRFVLIMWEEQRTVIVKNQAIADSFRAQFHYLWTLGRKIPGKVARVLDNPAYVEGLRKKAATRKRHQKP